MIKNSLMIWKKEDRAEKIKNLFYKKRKIKYKRKNE